MKEWLEHGYYETVKRVKNDAVYQMLLQKCAQQECLYKNILQKLTPEERLVVEDYIALCEELQYQKTHTAYYCGKEAAEEGKAWVGFMPPICNDTAENEKGDCRSSLQSMYAN